MTSTTQISKPPRRCFVWPILPRWSLAVALAVFGPFLVYAFFHLTIVKDITALLPAEEGRDPSVLELARNAGLMQKVVIVIGPDAPGSLRLHRSIDAVAAKVKALEGVGQVLGRVELATVQRAAELIMARSARLYAPPTGAALKDSDVRQRLEDLKLRLAAPEAMVMQPYLLADPLGLARQALQGLEATGTAQGAVVESGHLFCADRRYGLVVIDLAFDPFDIAAATHFVTALDAAVRAGMAEAGAGGITATVLGGVHFAASSATAVVSDIGLSFTLALSGVAIVALVLAAFFRQLRLLAVSFLPGGLGIVLGIGVMAFFNGTLHAVTLGFSATITGISVDYSIHLLHRAAHQLRLHGLSTREAMTRALAEVAPSIVQGCAATVGSFVIIATSGFTGIREMAVLSGISVFVAMLGTLLLLPPFHVFLLGGRRVTVEAWAERRLYAALEGYAPQGTRRVLVLLFGAACVFLATVGALSARASGDPADLSYRDKDLEARRRLVTERFPGLQDQALLVASGQDVESALAANDALYTALVAAGVPQGEIVSVSPFLPSAARQQRSLDAVHALLGRPGVKQAFRDAGFAPEYIEAQLSVRPSPALVPEAYSGTSLALLVNDALHKTPTGFHVLTRVRAASDAAVSRIAGIVAAVPGAHLVSERLAAKRALTALQSELCSMILIWFAAATTFLFISRRSVAFALRAVLPPALGLLASLGLFGALGRPLTPVSVAAATLILGLGVDFGIFVQPMQRKEFAAAGLAVVASALTTIAGFGALMFARVGALADIGLSIAVGITVAFLSALLLVPALCRGCVLPGGEE